MRLCKYLSILCLVVYIAVASLPSSWLWFDPGEIAFADAEYGTAPSLIYERAIFRPVMVSYSTVTRDAVTNEIACEGTSGPFEYQPVSGAVVGKTLEWWTAGDDACRSLPIGAYRVTTTWRVVTPLRALLPEWAKGSALDYLLPPKTITRKSAVFQIVEPS